MDILTEITKNSKVKKYKVVKIENNQRLVILNF